MDTFMDKLAQRFTAQEMIKANTAADAEQMKLLKEQVQEYSECLNRMQEVAAQIQRTAGEAQSKIGAARVDSGELQRLVDAGIEKINEFRSDAEAMEDLRAQLEEIRAAQGGTDDVVHRECVRTYRNVQAVVTEESSKQADSLMEVQRELGGRMKGVFAVSLAAFLISLAGVAFQILVWLHLI